uniref:Uncharacterized protein n=1 Tax=Nelumbo nucifera TaxID=4432 RepID=A0A822YJD6_NELNU|nr:TPA_asm: hypothetical protein HUJ06_004944 [Nelumbo nucifera]
MLINPVLGNRRSCHVLSKHYRTVPCLLDIDIFFVFSVINEDYAMINPFCTEKCRQCSIATCSVCCNEPPNPATPISPERPVWALFVQRDLFGPQQINECFFFGSNQPY